MNHLQEQYDFCTKKLAELQRQTDLRQTEIKDCLTKGQKDKAKLVLKRKKIIEKQMVAVQNVRACTVSARVLCAGENTPPPHPDGFTPRHAVQNQDRLMEQLMQLDMSQNNILTVQALAQAAEAGKANLKANDLENVEEVLDDIADQNSQMAQMQDALAMPTGMMAEMDGDELDDELAVRVASNLL